MGGIPSKITCLIAAIAMLPSYPTDYLHLGVGQMGFVLSAVGFGASVGLGLRETAAAVLIRRVNLQAAVGVGL